MLWYYTPMARSFTNHLQASAIVYDCMDELSLFKDAPAAMKAAEEELFARADVVFTGGLSLYEAKREYHSNIHPMPSSIDVDHFRKARSCVAEPSDQQAIPHPRLGFAGVIDERLDVELLDRLANAHPDWHFVMIGPVVKIDPAILPHYSNVHYLGFRSYADLPAYFSGWDVALMPFARNDATRYISPTKTPEYLVAGKPVVSTSIHDVVRSYADHDVVRIADDPDTFAAAVSQSLSDHSNAEVRAQWLHRVDNLLKDTSWDHTWSQMMVLLDKAIAERDRGIEHLRSTGSGERLCRDRQEDFVSHFIRSSMFDYLIVGAGFAGCVLAERLARGSSKKVLLSGQAAAHRWQRLRSLQRRGHIGS